MMRLLHSMSLVAIFPKRLGRLSARLHRQGTLLPIRWLSESNENLYQSQTNAFSRRNNTQVHTVYAEDRLINLDVDSILRTWPKPPVRDFLNDIVASISAESSYVLRAKEHYVDSVLWKKIIMFFRRVLQKEPKSVFKTEPAFSAFIKTLDECMMNENDRKQIKHLKEMVFSAILSITHDNFSEDMKLYKSVLSASDLRVPHDWYPAARLRKRRIIYHGGPTNSGKTYQALKRLREADPEKGGGIYCGPLRLLALEVYENLTRQGIYCDLLTGQEKRALPHSTHVSCTLEMVNIQREFDVAVIDEIQMISNAQRGHSWTRAVQGLLANEIHVCGGLEASDRLREMVLDMGDDFELVNYERLSKLVVADSSLKGDYGKIEKGDCVVAFSRADLFSIKAEIERLTPHKCCLVYGQLPPETRSLQARLFNDEGTGFDVLVASDAIGMGLNLNIKRVVFHTTVKRGSKVANASGDNDSWLQPTFVKQIAGRAGRLSSDYKYGVVTSWQEHDLAYIRACLSMDIPQIQKAGVFPSVEQLEEFSEHVKRCNDGVPINNLSNLMSRFVEAAQLDGRYELSEHSDLNLISNWLHPIPLSLQDRFIFSNAPVNTRDSFMSNIIYHYAAQYALKRPVGVSITISTEPPTNVLELSEVCMKHNVLDLYLWLSLRFPDWFVEREKCLEMKDMLIRLIETALESSNLHQKFCHHEEYKKIRQDKKKVDREWLLPPEMFGSVRDITAEFIQKVPPGQMFSFPHQVVDSKSNSNDSTRDRWENRNRTYKNYNKIENSNNKSESVDGREKFKKSGFGGVKKHYDRQRSKESREYNNAEVRSSPTVSNVNSSSGSSAKKTAIITTGVV